MSKPRAKETDKAKAKANAELATVAIDGPESAACDATFSPALPIRKARHVRQFRFVYSFTSKASSSFHPGLVAADLLASPSIGRPEQLRLHQEMLDALSTVRFANNLRHVESGRQLSIKKSYSCVNSIERTRPRRAVGHSMVYVIRLGAFLSTSKMMRGLRKPCPWKCSNVTHHETRRMCRMQSHMDKDPTLLLELSRGQSNRIRQNGSETPCRKLTAWCHNDTRQRCQIPFCKVCHSRLAEHIPSRY
jgi:hypothetical protein